MSSANKTVAFALLLSLLACLSLLPARCELAQSAKPKLVLLLVVDQFAYDYLSRFHDRFAASGFRFLQEHGANFTNCRYKQATTQTAVGHSVIASGAYPWASGIVGNLWYDRRRNQDIAAVYDDGQQLVGGPGEGASSHALNGTTIGDQLRLATNGRSKVIALSLKDRAALFLAGKMGNGAFWFDPRTGNFISSSQFGASLPAWVRAFNDQHYPDKFFGKAWQRLRPEAEYVDSTRDDYAYEGSFTADGKQFPHVITGGASSVNASFYATFAETPWASQMLVDLAKAAIEHESLGQHNDPDLLAISFSSPDMIGHRFGPYSQEAEDTMLRLDQSLSLLLAYVNQKVGLDRCTIVVTGDHGSTPVPEMLKERAGAHTLDAGRIDPQAFKTLLDSAMDARLGAEDWISSFLPPNLYLNLAAIDKEKYRQPDVEALAAKLAHSIPGIAEVYTANQLFTNQLPNGPYTEPVRRSYYWGRSGELYIVTKPDYIWRGESTGSSHSSPYAYDAQVPLILLGPNVQGGWFGNDASPADIAPTLASMLGITLPPLCEGRVLQEALRPVCGPPAPFPSAQQQVSLSLQFQATR